MSSSTSVKSRKPFALAMLVVLIWFLLTGVFGPLFGKLTSVQENNNSSFLPKGAEATRASELIQTFSGKIFEIAFPSSGTLAKIASPSADGKAVILCPGAK